MFAYSNISDDRDVIAKDLHDTFFSTELKVNDMFEDTDTQCVKMCDLVAAYIVSKEGSVLEYVKGILGAMIPPMYSYEFRFEYDGTVLTIGDGGGRPISSYSSKVAISDGKIMNTSLSLY
jgi:hypothetical protein